MICRGLGNVSNLEYNQCSAVRIGGAPKVHGIIFSEMKKYVEDTLGSDAWKVLVEREIARQTYSPASSYPDQEFKVIVESVAGLTRTTANTVVERFGEFIAPQLLGMVPSLLQPAWRTLDVIENTENTIHKLVRVQHAGATPPYLRVHRSDADEVVVFYDSPRKLCFLAKGIIKGLSVHFGDNVSITESRCMLNGAPDCTLTVKLDR